MATDQLSLYNIGLRFIGERELANISENREPRRLLDGTWNAGDGAVKFFLENGYWNFATRAVKIDKSASVTPAFGHPNAFDVPTDYVKLVQISGNEFFNDALTNYEQEGDYFYASIDPIYMRYVSDHADYGNDLSKWPQHFTRWAGSWLGVQVAPRLKNDVDLDKLEKREHKLLVRARSKDASEEPTRWPPLSSWNRARFGSNYSSGRRDRGSRSQLIG